MKQCMGCMEIYKDSTNVCPYCGYVEGTTTENTLHIEPGAILNNRYIVGRVLGYGGFGVTYIAWDSLLEQKVAIKEFLPSEFATRMLGRMEITIFSGDKEKQFMEGLVKFVEEAKKLAKFNNVPGIIKIFDCIEENNTAYIIMELLEGESLSTRIEKEKKMSADKAISMLLPVMESLRQVNSQGIIHRDIAPDNIFITKQNEIKLIDFGAARYATTSLSRSLTIIIKPGYSPEEQYRSMGDQGSWTDVYSIGATLYRMITGEVPCDSMERRAYIEQHGEDLLKPISKYTNKITKSQENAILNAMNVKIHERTPDMNRLIEELTSVTDIQRIEGKKDNISGITIPLWGKIASLVAVALIVVLTLVFGQNKESILLEKGMTRVPNIVNLPIEEAKEELRKNNLSCKVVGYTYSATYADNSVIYQSVAAGSKVSDNSQIDIKVSKIKETFEVSNVVAMNVKDAEEILKADNYTVTIGESKHNRVIPKDCVLKQETDETEGNKNVVLTVSKGPKDSFETGRIDTPNYEKMQFVDVIDQAAKDGVMIQVIERKASSEVEEGQIISQSVNGYNSVPNTVRRGTILRLVVSSGKNEVSISDYTNMNIDDVRALLTPRGIVVEEDCQLVEGYDHGIVFGQDPAAGSKLKTGGVIKLKVSIGSQDFKMISVVGKTEEEAERLLLRYGLKVKITKGYKKDVQEGYVISQSIEANKDSKVGDEIEILICDPSSDVVLPKMEGENIENVTKELEKCGIEYTIEKQFKTDIAKGIVISANPKAGTTVKIGSSVKLVVCAGPGDIPSVLSVVNTPLTEAKTTLQGQNLVIKEEYKFSSDKAEGVVLEQSIPAGEQASSGDEIILTVSKGPEATLELSDVYNFAVGDSTQIIASYSPQNKLIDWKVDNEEVIRIEPDSSPTPKGTSATWNAKIIGLKAGSATITATITYNDGTKLQRTKKVDVR